MRSPASSPVTPTRAIATPCSRPPSARALGQGRFQERPLGLGEVARRGPTRWLRRRDGPAVRHGPVPLSFDPPATARPSVAKQSLSCHTERGRNLPRHRGLVARRGGCFWRCVWRRFASVVAPLSDRSAQQGRAQRHLAATEEAIDRALREIDAFLEELLPGDLWATERAEAWLAANTPAAGGDQGGAPLSAPGCCDLDHQKCLWMSALRLHGQSQRRPTYNTLCSRSGVNNHASPEAGHDAVSDRLA